jgi:hypothetical protein
MHYLKTRDQHHSTAEKPFFSIYYNAKPDMEQKLLLIISSSIIVDITMKKLRNKLEVFFLALNLVEDCEFKRGLRIRPKSLNR